MIVITGASDGLGFELAKLYTAAGKKVVNISRRTCAYADENFLGDIRDSASITKVAARVEAIAEPLEAIINCAGVLSIQPLANITEEEVERVLSTNVQSAILLTSRLIGRVEQDSADIVNVASTLGLKGYPSLTVYGASKWAMPRLLDKYH